MWVYLAASLKITKIRLETKKKWIKGSWKCRDRTRHRKKSSKYSLNKPLKPVLATQPFQNSPLNICHRGKKGFNALGQPLLEKCLCFTPPVESGFCVFLFLSGYNSVNLLQWGNQNLFKRWQIWATFSLNHLKQDLDAACRVLHWLLLENRNVKCWMFL